MHKSDNDCEAGVPPTPELMARMGAFLDEMTNAGVFLAAEGLQPSSVSVRLRFAAGRRTVIRGPLSRPEEMLSEFALVRAPSMEKAIEWTTRLGSAAVDAVIEIGQIKEPWDLGLCPEPENHARRFLIMHQAPPSAESGHPPTSQAGNAFPKWIEELSHAGVLLSSERLQPVAKSSRLNLSRGKISIIDGPFIETRELIGGFCIARVGSKEEAIAWASRFAQLLATSRPEPIVELDLIPLLDPH